MTDNPAPPPCEACLKADAMSTEFMPNRDRLRFRQVTIDTHHALLASKDAEIAELRAADRHECRIDEPYFDHHIPAPPPRRLRAALAPKVAHD